MNNQKKLNKAFENFKFEAENFFVSKFLFGNELKRVYTRCLDIIYRITGNEDSSKGIMAYNRKYGQGKSFFFEVVYHRERRLRKRTVFVQVSAIELCNIYKNAPKDSDPEKEINKFISCRNLFIDDLGEELKNGNFTHHYGNKINVLRYVILERYRLWTKKSFKTHFTTNLTIEEIAENYDGRVADRLKQMTHFFHFDFLKKDQTFRQVEETRKLEDFEIEANRKKLEPKTKTEKVDLIAYLNREIEEDIDYLRNLDSRNLIFLRYCLEKHNIIDFSKLVKKLTVPEKAKMVKEAMEIQQKQDEKDSLLVSKTAKKFSENVTSKIRSLSQNEFDSIVLNQLTKREFLKLKEKNHKFKSNE